MIITHSTKIFDKTYNVNNRKMNNLKLVQGKTCEVHLLIKIMQWWKINACMATSVSTTPFNFTDN